MMWLQGMLAHDFIRHAFIAGTGIALASGLVGYFLVLRSQVFSSDALGHVAFAGALAALIFGLDARVGLFAFTILAAIVLGSVGERGRTNDIAIGGFFAWVLGLGALFLTLYTTSSGATNGTSGVKILFGSIFGLSLGSAVTAALIGIGISAAVLVLARPLLFASLDEAVALARGIPVRILGLIFLVLVGITTAEATQAVGALLILGLLAAPAGAAQQLTSRPFMALGLSTLFAVSSVWLGLILAYAVPRLPPSFAILSIASAFYILAGLVSFARPRLKPTPVKLGAALLLLFFLVPAVQLSHPQCQDYVKLPHGDGAPAAKCLDGTRTHFSYVLLKGHITKELDSYGGWDWKLYERPLHYAETSEDTRAKVTAFIAAHA